ncbi:MAG: NAD(P)H-quinone oxidoreductase [Bacteroidota bacterium]
MKAVTFSQPGSAEVLQIQDVPQPSISEQEILVQVAATALNRADIMQRQGMYPPPPGASDILGLEVAGTVVKCDPQAKRFKEGDEVMALLPGGGYAEYVNIDEGLAMPIPKGISLQEAAAIPEVFLTAFQALHWLGKMSKGDKVLIHAGGSGVGTAAIQLARLMKAEIFTTASAPKLAACEQLGAHHLIDYQSKSFEEVVAKATEGKGVDIILDFIAAPYLLPNLNSLGMDGRLILLALMGGIKVDSFNMLPILRKRIQLIGTTLRARSLTYKRELVADFSEKILPAFEEGSLKTVIDSYFPLEKVQEAHTYMEGNKNTGKIILTLTDS